MNDLRFAFRQLLKSPGFTAGVVLSLALGIGANSTALCWIRALLLHPIPGAIRQEEIVGFVSNQGSGNTSLLDIRDLGSLKQVFAGAVASQISPASLTADDRTEWIYGQVATANFFDLLGVKPILGRTFLPDEDLKPGGNAVLVLSETLWRGRFAGDSNVVGKVVQLNRRAFTIVGVVPYSDVPYGAQSVLGPALRLLLAVTIGVLLIVAANVASLLLARATRRQKEIAIRLAAGAGRARLIRQLLTGVEEVTLASWLPLGLAGSKGHGVDAEGYQRRPGENPTYEYAIVAPRYFATLRILLIEGRDFTDRDDADAPRVTIINEAFARRFCPGQNPIGRKFRAGGEERQVVGMVKTGKYNRLSEEPWSFFYLPYQQYVPDLDLSLVVRTRGDAAAFARTVSGVVRELDPGVALWGTTRMTDHVATTLFVQRTASRLLTVLSTIALTLAAMGVYAVMACAVSQRTQEFGVRMALGAQVGDVVSQVLRQGLALVALGTVIGLGLALAVTHLLAGFLYGVSPFDVLTFVAVPLLLGAVARLACWLPARRAANIDPMVALRCE